MNIQSHISLLLGVDSLLDGLSGAQLLLCRLGARGVGDDDIVEFVL